MRIDIFSTFHPFFIWPNTLFYLRLSSLGFPRLNELPRLVWREGRGGTKQLWCCCITKMVLFIYGFLTLPRPLFYYIIAVSRPYVQKQEIERRDMQRIWVGAGNFCYTAAARTRKQGKVGLRHRGYVIADYVRYDSHKYLHLIGFGVYLGEMGGGWVALYGAYPVFPLGCEVLVS